MYVCNGTGGKTDFFAQRINRVIPARIKLAARIQEFSAWSPDHSASLMCSIPTHLGIISHFSDTLVQMLFSCTTLVCISENIHFLAKYCWTSHCLGPTGRIIYRPLSLSLHRLQAAGTTSSANKHRHHKHLFLQCLRRPLVKNRGGGILWQV